MRKIMILGASIYQVPLIKKAKEMGLYVVCVSIPGDYPGFKYADKVYYINTRDEEGVLKAAKDEQISGVCTTGTDVALKAVGYVNDKLKLNGVSFASACICTDKALMKECFTKHSVNTAKFAKAYSFNEAKLFYAMLGCAVIIKPVDSSGSRGISKATNYEELEAAYKKATSMTKKEYVIIEQFLEGYEIGVDAFVVKGKVLFTAIHGKVNYDNGSTCVPVGHYFPFEASDDLIKKIEEECKKVIVAVGMNDCSVNMDVMISGGEPYILEASGRCGATCIPELISLYYDFDYYKQMISCALGDKVEFEEKNHRPCIAKLIVSDKSGAIVAQESITNDPTIRVSFDYKIGDRINKFKVGPDRIGQIVAVGTDIDEDKIVKIVVE